MTNVPQSLLKKVERALESLGADTKVTLNRGLPLYQDAHELVVAHVSDSGREHLLIPDAATSWAAMRDQASLDDVRLVMISGFRSFEKQLSLLRDRVQSGTVEDVLTVLAPPGCSEHHTGRAVDIGTPGCDPLSESFERTQAFAWLTSHAMDYGFSLSYPKNNEYGFLYEPWHWCFKA
ncbi:MAG: M15 family metallopeptidase [Pseudomonadota bacterium]